MKYQKIRGKSVAECMMKLRGSHGSDAIILEHREIDEGGLLGSKLFSRKSVEVEYMLEEKNFPKALPASSLEKRFVREEKMLSAKKALAAPKNLERDLERDLGNSSDAFLRRIPHFAGPSPNPLSMRKTVDGPKSSHLLRIEKQLNTAQMSPAFTSDFLCRLEESLSPKEKEEYGKVERKTMAVLSGIVRVKPSQPPAQGECKAFALIGPTGSGKTTSLAKLAARFRLIEKREVSIYSLDHYRLAATEQLKTYAGVMGAEFHAPISKEEFTENLRRDGAEIILVDTSGAAYSDKKRIGELKEYLKVCEQEISLECSLVLAANTNPSLLERVILAYDTIGFDKLILTKIDETDFIGAFIEIADKFRRPFSFVTDGQEVPADIRDADAEEIAARALGLEWKEKKESP